MIRDRFRAARLLALLIPLALLGGALAFQYIGKLYPCEMCWWQRYPHIAALVLAALAFVVPLLQHEMVVLELLERKQQLIRALMQMHLPQ